MKAFSDPILQALYLQQLAKPAKLRLIEPATPEQYFGHLSESILSQQLSTKVADVIQARAKTLLGGEWVPEKVLAIAHDDLRAVGLSNAKARYLKNLAEFWLDPAFTPQDIPHMEDEEVITTLTQIKGIGRWTVEMFLIFALARPDVFSAGDGGLQRAIFQAYNLPKTTSKEELIALAEAWAPHRSLASRVLWASLD
jgi:DNA-3-methyladenine glycosylase II